MTNKLKPSDFAAKMPYSSVFGKAECEFLAKRILHHTESFNKPLTWEEYYETMTQADKNVAHAVKRDFDRVSPYLVSAHNCAMFSPTWKEIYESAKSE